MGGGVGVLTTLTKFVNQSERQQGAGIFVTTGISPEWQNLDS